MKRYLTRGTNDQIPIDIQFFCWQCYEAAKARGEYDYLQVFELTVTADHMQQIEHRQEVPEYKQVYQINSLNPMKQKIFIIDEGEYATMLLAEEY
ncbi:hypothetical protein GMA92_09625 [Turicibacter sanguinis]|mgnify:CR=1 FL=1|uniref:DUF960 domain-containing protein n=1 Tax=Turicibacter sanguinis TaxID=154288 RepID=A0A9X4XEV6_9FIRM|nr:DUF960 family protein [Turicibacter sanguinis]KAB6699927.1 DUF960 domain-containing protein [Phocaeicola vulgatus]MTK21678.1 hypothetical protein [Turicibacter sanguinis]MTK73158.1 hypothetical protein [Turicibacter sanguinis]